MKFPRIAPATPDPPGVTVPAWLVRAAKLASWMAYASLVYFLLLYTLDIARDRAGALHITHAGPWSGDLRFWFPYVVGFGVVAIGIPYVAKIAIPTFTRLSWREAPTEKAWALLIAVAVSLVIVAGTFTVQGDTLLERDRAAAVAVDTAAQEAAVLTARIADVQHAMDERTRSESVYVRTAASMSPEAYDRFVEGRRGDWQYERLLSYRAVSEEMARLNREMSDLRAQQARQTVSSAVVHRVETAETGWIARTLGVLEGLRAMLLSFVMDIVCLIMPMIALRLELKRNEQLAAGAGALEAHMLADLREEPTVTPQPMAPAREVVRDAETGEELIFKRGTKPHWARKPKKREKTQATLKPEDTGDETGVHDPARSGSTATPEAPADQDGAEAQLGDDQQQDGEGVAQTELPDYTPEELAALYAEPESPASAGAPEATPLPDGEGVMLDDDRQQEESHDAHVRARALIAAE